MLIIWLSWLCEWRGSYAAVLSEWQKGSAQHYGVLGNSAVLPQLSCGYLQGTPSFDIWPFGKVVSLSASSNISLKHGLDGCGACLEVKCTDNSCNSQSGNEIVSVYDICSTQQQSVQCTSDELLMPAYVFQQFASYQRARISIEFRQIDCQPSQNITLSVVDYVSGAGGYLKVLLSNVVGDGSIARVELRNMPDSGEDALRDLNSFWMNMTRAENAAFEFSGLPPPPLDLRITSGDNQVIVLRNAISQCTQRGNYNSKAQFKMGQFPTRIPIVKDLGDSCAKQEESVTIVPKSEQNVQYTQDAQEFCECTDNLPSGVPFSCQDQLRFGRCNEPFMRSGNWCAATCGRCSCQTAESKAPNFGDPFAQGSPVLPLSPPPPAPSVPQDPPLIAVELPQGVQSGTICPLSLTGLIRNSPDLQRFFQAMEAVRLTSRLSDPYIAVTILAPNNYAFDQLMQSIGMEFDDFKSQYPGLLQRIILYNMLPGVWDSRRFLVLDNPLPLITMLPDSSIDISFSQRFMELEFTGPTNTARTISGDLSICKSMIHYIDKVMFPFKDYTLLELADFKPVTDIPFGSEGFISSTNSSIEPITEIGSDSLSTVIIPTFSPPPPQISAQAINIPEDVLNGECGYDQGFQDVVQCPSILRILERTPCLGIFLQLVRIAGYEEVFEDVSKQYTIFTPTNSSFEALFQSEGTTLEQIANVPDQVRILIGYHVVNGMYTREQLQLVAASDNNLINSFIQFREQSLPLTFTFQPSGQKVVVQGVGSNATIEREVFGCDSVLHIVDNVLLPASASSEDQSSPIPSSPLPVPSPTSDGSDVGEGTFPSIAPYPNPQPCSDISMQQFFVERGAGLGDVRFFDVMLVLSKLQDQVYFPSQKLVVLVPTNDGVDRGLKTINETFTSLLGSTNQGLSVLVQYHVLRRDEPLEGLFQPNDQDTVKSLTTSYGRNTIRIARTDYAEDGSLLSISGGQTNANVLERVPTCEGFVYVLDNLLLPNGFDLGS